MSQEKMKSGVKFILGFLLVISMFLVVSGVGYAQVDSCDNIRNNLGLQIIQQEGNMVTLKWNRVTSAEWYGVRLRDLTDSNGRHPADARYPDCSNPAHYYCKDRIFNPNSGNEVRIENIQVRPGHSYKIWLEVVGTPQCSSAFLFYEVPPTPKLSGFYVDPKRQVRGQPINIFFHNPSGHEYCEFESYGQTVSPFAAQLTGVIRSPSCSGPTSFTIPSDFSIPTVGGSGLLTILGRACRGEGSNKVCSNHWIVNLEVYSSSLAPATHPTVSGFYVDSVRVTPGQQVVVSFVNPSPRTENPYTNAQLCVALFRDAYSFPSRTLVRATSTVSNDLNRNCAVRLQMPSTPNEYLLEGYVCSGTDEALGQCDLSSATTIFPPSSSGSPTPTSGGAPPAATIPCNDNIAATLGTTYDLCIGKTLLTAPLGSPHFKIKNNGISGSNVNIKIQGSIAPTHQATGQDLADWLNTQVGDYGGASGIAGSGISVQVVEVVSSGPTPHIKVRLHPSNGPPAAALPPPPSSTSSQRLMRISWPAVPGVSTYNVRVADLTDNTYNTERSNRQGDFPASVTCDPSPHMVCENGVNSLSLSGIRVVPGHTYQYWFDTNPPIAGCQPIGTINVPTAPVSGAPSGGVPPAPTGPQPCPPGPSSLSHTITSTIGRKMWATLRWSSVAGASTYRINLTEKDAAGRVTGNRWTDTRYTNCNPHYYCVENVPQVDNPSITNVELNKDDNRPTYYEFTVESIMPATFTNCNPVSRSRIDPYSVATGRPIQPGGPGSGGEGGAGGSGPGGNPGATSGQQGSSVSNSPEGRGGAVMGEPETYGPGPAPGPSGTYGGDPDPGAEPDTGGIPGEAQGHGLD